LITWIFACLLTSPSFLDFQPSGSHSLNVPELPGALTQAWGCCAQARQGAGLLRTTVPQRGTAARMRPCSGAGLPQVPMPRYGATCTQACPGAELLRASAQAWGCCARAPTRVPPTHAPVDAGFSPRASLASFANVRITF